jgi:hypothetical protein
MLVYIAQRDWDEIIRNTIVGVSLFEAGAFISITLMIFTGYSILWENMMAL